MPLSEFVPMIPEKFGIHPALGSEMLRTDIGDSVMKHLAQNSSLLSLLEENNLFRDSTCFIEFGSGRGKITSLLIVKYLSISHSIKQFC